MHRIINGCIEVLEQSESFLLSATPLSYQNITKPHFISSCGEHMRHILDHFNAVIRDFDSGTIDYDKRQRGSQVESDISCAQNQIKQIKEWLMSLEHDSLDSDLLIKTEVSISTEETVHARTCLGRELVFIAAHAIHHFSIMSLAMQMQDLEVDTNFGIAPATQTHLRSSEKCAP